MRFKQDSKAFKAQRAGLGGDRVQSGTKRNAAGSGDRSAESADGSSLEAAGAFANLLVGQLLIGAAQEIEVNPFAVAPVKVAAGQGGEVPAQGSVPLLSPR